MHFDMYKEFLYLVFGGGGGLHACRGGGRGTDIHPNLLRIWILGRGFVENGRRHEGRGGIHISKY